MQKGLHVWSLITLPLIVGRVLTPGPVSRFKVLFRGLGFGVMRLSTHVMKGQGKLETDLFKLTFPVISRLAAGVLRDSSKCQTCRILDPTWCHMSFVILAFFQQTDCKTVFDLSDRVWHGTNQTNLGGQETLQRLTFRKLEAYKRSDKGWS